MWTKAQASCADELVEPVMLNRRSFARLAGATALSGLAIPALPRAAFAQGAAPAPRGSYLVKNGTVITVDPTLGVLSRGDVHVREGRIEAIGLDLTASGAEVIDA